MYLDISVRKILVLAAMAGVLAALLVGTFTVKADRYGSTPFYSAVGLLWQQMIGYTIYPFERAIGSLFSGAGAAGAARGEAAGIPVVTYHRLVEESDGANVTFVDFKDQLEALKNSGWNTITLAQYEAYMRGDISLPAKSVLITFDDGAKQSFYPVDPILRELGYNAVNYIIVGDSTKEGTTYYLSSPEIRNMLETGRWEIGSHSYAGHHPYPIDAAAREGHFFSDKLWLADETRLETDAEFRARVLLDLRESKTALEETYNVPISGFAFPFGDTGETSVNYPESHGIVTTAVREVYDYAWVQVGKGQYSYNYPHEDAFLNRRIKVAPDWNGGDLLAALEKGMGKEFPYDATPQTDDGWLTTWGEIEESAEGILFAGSADVSGASAFLDGTGAWRNYEAIFTGNWKRGFAMTLASLGDAQNYRDCAFDGGAVSIRSVVNGERETLAHREDPRIRHGENVSLGVRVQGGIQQCLYNGAVVLEARGLADRIGGIGFQVWDEQLDSASFLIERIAVRDVANERLISPVFANQKTQNSTPSIPNTGASSAGSSRSGTTGVVVPNNSSQPPVSTGAVVIPEPQIRPPQNNDGSEEPRNPRRNRSWEKDSLDEIRENVQKKIEEIAKEREEERKQREDQRKERNRSD